MAELLLGALVSLAIVYALLQLLKGVAKLRDGRERKETARLAAAVLCQNCAILHGQRGERFGQQAGSLAELSGHKRPLEGPGGYLKCGACSARFRWSVTESGHTFYGKNLALAQAAQGLGAQQRQCERPKAPDKGAERGDDDVHEDDDDDDEPEGGGSSERLAEDLRRFVEEARGGREWGDERRKSSADTQSDSCAGCSLQTVFEVTMAPGKPAACTAGPPPATSTPEGPPRSSQAGASWRKLLQAARTVSQVERLAKARRKSFGAGALFRLKPDSTSSSSSSSSTSSSSSRSSAGPELINSRKLRQAKIQM